jgi:hypothetical protein
MYKILLIGGLALVKVMAFGFMGFHISVIIHLLPLIAIVGFMISFFYRKTFSHIYIPLNSKTLIIKYPGNNEVNKIMKLYN